MVGWGRVYQDDLWVAKSIGEPAPTGFIQYLSGNFMQHFTSLVGAGSPKFLTPIDKLSKPAPSTALRICRYFSPISARLPASGNSKS